MYRLILACGLMISAAGCNSLGLSLSPPRNFLTEQAEAVVNHSPRHVSLPRELDMTVLPSHYLQPGDVLLVEPVELDSEVRLPTDQKVQVDGTIDLSAYGRVIVAGLTIEAAELLIEKTIRDSGAEATQVNVRLLENVHRIYVLGEVASPGSYPFLGNETVLDGILVAGGLTSQADACRVILVRPTPPPSCRVALPICYREITQLGDTTTNYQLQPGDRIYVASRSWCDDLQFWKAKDTCDRCCRCQVPCPDPRVADFANPITQILPPPPALPATENASEVKSDAGVDGQVGETGFVEDRSDASSLPSPSVRRTFPPSISPDDAPSIDPKRREGQLDFDPPLPQTE